MADFFGLRLSCLDYQQGGFQGNPSPCWACLYEMISSNASMKQLLAQNSTVIPRKSALE